MIVTIIIIIIIIIIISIIISMNIISHYYRCREGCTRQARGRCTRMPPRSGRSRRTPARGSRRDPRSQYTTMLEYNMI